MYILVYKSIQKRTIEVHAGSIRVMGHPRTIIQTYIYIILSSSNPHAYTLLWHSFWHTIWKYLWHMYIYIYVNYIYWHSIWHSFWHIYIYFLKFYLTFFLAFYLSSIHYSDILSGIFSDLLSGICSDILSGIYSGTQTKVVILFSWVSASTPANVIVNLTQRQKQPANNDAMTWDGHRHHRHNKQYIIWKLRRISVHCSRSFCLILLVLYFFSRPPFSNMGLSKRKYPQKQNSTVYGYIMLHHVTSPGSPFKLPFYGINN